MQVNIVAFIGDKPEAKSSYHLTSLCTARPAAMRRNKTTGIAAIVRPNSAELVCRTTMRSYANVKFTLAPTRAATR